MKHVINNTIPRQGFAEKAADVALALFIGFSLAMLLASWWSS